METIDNIFSSVRDVVNDLGQKANDVVEVSKLRLSVVSLGSDIDKVYQKLGLMVYEMVKAGTANRELIDGCVAEVDALKAKLDEINRKIDELKNVRRCDSCGNAVDISAQFCPMCGSLLHKPEADYRVVEENEQKPAPEEPAGEPVSEPAAAPGECPCEEPAAEEPPKEEPPRDETAGQ